MKVYVMTYNYVVKNVINGELFTAQRYVNKAGYKMHVIGFI